MKTNRDYFSWSQYILWQTSKREFWKRYQLGAPQVSNRFYDKGKELAEYLATGVVPTQCKDDMIDIVVLNIPKLDLFEEDLTYEVDGHKILCYTDSSDHLGTEFLEYKSGKIPWTQELVNEHDQLLFYALGYWYRNEKQLIPNCKLVWVETMQTEDGLMYTGNVEVFDRKFTTKELNAFEKKLVKTIKEIEEFEYSEIEVDEDVVRRYAELKEIVEDATQEMELIKLQVYAELSEAGCKFGAGEIGNFFITERKSWEYSETLKEFQKSNATAVTKMQKEEQKLGVAKCTTNESLTFRLKDHE